MCPAWAALALCAAIFVLLCVLFRAPDVWELRYYYRCRSPAVSSGASLFNGGRARSWAPCDTRRRYGTTDTHVAHTHSRYRKRFMFQKETSQQCIWNVAPPLGSMLSQPAFHRHVHVARALQELTFSQPGSWRGVDRGYAKGTWQVVWKLTPKGLNTAGSAVG